MTYKKLILYGALIVSATLALVVVRFLPSSHGIASSDPIINLTQSLQILKVSTAEYEQRLKTRPGIDAPTEMKQLRDYVVTLKNNSSKEVIAYRIDCTKQDDARFSQSAMSHPAFADVGFGPGTTEVKRIIGIPAGHACRLSLAVFKGFVYEGDRTTAETVIARLRAARDKTAVVRDRLTDIAKLPDSELGSAYQAFLSEMQQEQSRLAKSHTSNKAGASVSVDEKMRSQGEFEALGMVLTSVTSITRMDNAALAKQVADSTLQRLKSYLARME